jgi:hypothetical protein
MEALLNFFITLVGIVFYIFIPLQIGALANKKNDKAD